MGWGKVRDRTFKRVEKDARNLSDNVNAEIRRLGNRLASSPDRAVSSVNLNVGVAAAISQPVPPFLKNSPKNDETLGAAISCEEAASAVQLPSKSNTNPLNLQPGLAFIINHNTFEESEFDERNGSEVDIQKIEKVLERFQFPTTTVKNGSLSEVKSIMDEIENLNFSKYACMILVIMSHGYENDIIAAKDGHYSLNSDVLYPILRNQSLVGKPKLMFVQSCKGLTDLILSTDSRKLRGQPTKIPDGILQFNSCVEGYCSYRHKNGSIFIHFLCEKLEKFGDTEDIREICNKVIDAVKREFAKMQIPMIHTNITEKFVLGHYKA